MWPIDNDVAAAPSGARDLDPEVWVELQTGDWVSLEVLATTKCILSMLTPEASYDLKLFVCTRRHDMMDVTVGLLKACGFLDESGHLFVTVHQILAACAGSWATPGWGEPEAFYALPLGLAEQEAFLW
jgi:hypothetical protein